MLVENPDKIQLLDVMTYHPSMATSNSTRFNGFNATETGTSSGNVCLLALDQL